MYSFEDMEGREHRVSISPYTKTVDVLGEARTIIMEADGTHYALTIIPVGRTGNRYIGDAQIPQNIIIGGIGRNVYCFRNNGYLAPSYIMEKLRCSITDAYNIIHMIEYIRKNPYFLEERKISF